MPARDAVRLLRAHAAFAALPARELEALDAAQASEASVIVKVPADSVVALAERCPSIIREIALTIGRRLRTAHDSVKSLAVDPVEAGS